MSQIFAEAVVSDQQAWTSPVAACRMSRRSATRRPGSWSVRRRRFPDGNYYDEYRIGGTSLSSPIFAGLMALADQAAGRPHGFANPLFYAHPGAFYDVLSVKTAVARRNFNNSVDASAGTVGLPSNIRRLLRLADAAHRSRLGQRDRPRRPNGIFNP